LKDAGVPRDILDATNYLRSLAGPSKPAIEPAPVPDVEDDQQQQNQQQNQQQSESEADDDDDHDDHEHDGLDSPHPDVTARHTMYCPSGCHTCTSWCRDASDEGTSTGRQPSSTALAVVDPAAAQAQAQQARARPLPTFSSEDERLLLLNLTTLSWQRLDVEVQVVNTRSWSPWEVLNVAGVHNCLAGKTFFLDDNGKKISYTAANAHFVCCKSSSILGYTVLVDFWSVLSGSRNG
jgi:hypothetical protein